MRSEVTVTFKDKDPVQIELSREEPMAADVARGWFDRQFTEFACEPLRATGKVLTADKVVVVAEAAGPGKFAEEKWAREFGRATRAALGKDVVHIDVPTLSISY
jgi:hypothetical protein